jgi:hypothetical protein
VRGSFASKRHAGQLPKPAPQQPAPTSALTSP